MAVGIQEQAELTREMTLAPQALLAYVGTAATSADQPSVKSAQNSWLSSRRPGMLLARMARRQLSALQGCVLGHFSRLVILTR